MAYLRRISCRGYSAIPSNEFFHHNSPVQRKLPDGDPRHPNCTCCNRRDWSKYGKKDPPAEPRKRASNRNSRVFTNRRELSVRKMSVLIFLQIDGRDASAAIYSNAKNRRGDSESSGDPGNEIAKFRRSKESVAWDVERRTRRVKDFLVPRQNQAYRFSANNFV